MSVGQEFWLVATGGSDKDGNLAQLKGRSELGRNASNFGVPTELRFGSFDSLIRLTDDLQKADASIESTVHRLERQYLEIDPKADFKIIFKRPQRQEKSLVDYLNNWQWDESRYSKTDSISETLQALLPKMAKLDEEARKKTAEFNDVKSQRATMAKKDGNILTQDLVDILTPQVVRCSGDENDDFVYSKFLSTVVVVLGKGTDKEFLACYESLTPQVVPQSAKCFTSLTDKDGNSIWRVVLCTAGVQNDGKSNPVDNFKRACRERRFVARDFEYSADGHKKLVASRQRLDQEVQAQQAMITGIYRDAWSDVMHALVHVKAMRIFVESVLRFGMPPKFCSFVLSPPANKVPLARKALAALLGKGQAGPAAEGDDDEEFFPYVSLTFVPFTATRG